MSQGAEFPVRAVLDNKAIEQLIAALNKAGKAAGLTDDQIKALGKDLEQLNTKGKPAISSVEASLNRLNKTADMAKNAVMGFFTVQGLKMAAEFVWNVSQLAAKAEGVRVAFDKLPRSIQLMQDLKRATMGTVSELELMQRAVQANNFGINLQKLPAMLEFATARAKQSGQDINFLVDSIITGLGRKSVQILDNLGISANAIHEEVAKVGDFSTAVGNIIEREAAAQGDALETLVTKTGRLSASWENLKVAMGDAANDSGVIGTSIDMISMYFEILASKALGAEEKFAALASPTGALAAYMTHIAKTAELANVELEKHKEIIAEVDKAMASGNAEAYIDALEKEYYTVDGLNKLAAIRAEYTSRLVKEKEKEASSIENIQNLSKQLAELEKKKLLVTGANLAQTNREIEALKKKIDVLDKLGLAYKEFEKLNAVGEKFSRDFTEGLLKGFEPDMKELKDAMDRINFGEGIFFELPDAEDSEIKGLKSLEDIERQKQELRQETYDQAVNLGNAWFDYQQRQNENEMNMARARFDYELLMAGDNKDAQLKVKQELLQKQAETENRMAMFQLAISQGPAVAKTLAQSGFPAALPMVLLVAAQFGLLLAAQRRVQQPRFAADGAFDIDGPGTERSDSIPFMLSKHESVVPAHASKKFGFFLKPLIEGNEQAALAAMNMRLRGDLFTSVVATDSDRVVDKLDKMNNTLGKLKQMHINIDEHGFKKWLHEGLQETTYLNRRYRS
ncbi:MAG: hypothetical protein KF775_02255 [Cyclobacteriaceae bacterium]|nr:hypothetical protein [Cyclobacteriaceae bacterium]